LPNFLDNAKVAEPRCFCSKLKENVLTNNLTICYNLLFDARNTGHIAVRNYVMGANWQTSASSPHALSGARDTMRGDESTRWNNL